MYDNVNECLWDIRYQLIIHHILYLSPKWNISPGWLLPYYNYYPSFLSCFVNHHLSRSFSPSICVFPFKPRQLSRWAPPVVWSCSKFLPTRQFFLAAIAPYCSGGFRLFSINCAKALWDVSGDLVPVNSKLTNCFVLFCFFKLHRLLRCLVSDYMKATLGWVSPANHLKPPASNYETYTTCFHAWYTALYNS